MPLAPLTIALLTSLASQGTGMAVNALSNLKTKKAEKDILKADLARLQSGQLGLGPEEIAQLTATAQAAAGAQAGALAADVERQSLAGGSGNQMSGKTAKLVKDIAGSAGAAAAKPVADVNVFSRQLASSQAQEIKNRLAGYNTGQVPGAKSLQGDITGLGQTAAMGSDEYAQMMAKLSGEALTV